MKAEEYEKYKGRKASALGEAGVVCGYDPEQEYKKSNMCLLMHRPDVKREFRSHYPFVIDEEYREYDCFWITPNEVCKNKVK